MPLDRHPLPDLFEQGAVVDIKRLQIPNYGLAKVAYSVQLLILEKQVYDRAVNSLVGESPAFVFVPHPD